MIWRGPRRHLPRFDLILVLDWSANGTPKHGADSIWLGSDRDEPVNPSTRARAFRMIEARLDQATRAGHRVLLGADLAFGHPSGLALRITGRPDALALWDHLSDRHQDDERNRSNYREIAAEMNRRLGRPVFWGNGRKQQIPDLPRLCPPPVSGLPRHRVTENPFGAARPKSPFQLAGAGCVGAQSLTGIPWLNRLRQRPGVVVWPFQPWQDAGVVLAEVYSSIIAAELRLVGGFSCRDAAQVTVLACALRQMDDDDLLVPALAPDPRVADMAAEGQILGFGHENRLRAAARAVSEAGAFRNADSFDGVRPRHANPRVP